MQAIKDALDEASKLPPPPEPPFSQCETEEYLKARDEALRSIGFW